MTEAEETQAIAQRITDVVASVLLEHLGERRATWIIGEIAAVLAEENRRTLAGSTS